MNIGTQLKKTRLYLGLTKEQFSAGIVTEAYYSRVENNKNHLKMKDLLEILERSQVSLYDFFEPIIHEDTFSREPVNTRAQEMLDELKAMYQQAVKAGNSKQAANIKKIFNLTGYEKFLLDQIE